MNALLLVMFGTSVENGLQDLLHIRDRMALHFPRTLLNVAFSSKIIRGVWTKRAADRGYREAHPEIPDDIFTIRSPLDAMRILAGKEIQGLVVQPVQIAPVERGKDISEFIPGLESAVSDKFGRIAVGRPALGYRASSRYPYVEDVEAIARSVEQDAVMARQEQAALFYLGHGDGHASTEKAYQELVMALRKRYPDIPTVMSLVKGGAATSELIGELRKRRVKNIILKPFMVVAGNHVKKEMIRKVPNSLKPLLENAGFVVHPVASGLGRITAFADIYARHADDAAREAGIELS